MLADPKVIRLYAQANPDWLPKGEDWATAVLPCIRSLNTDYLPIWNTGVLDEAWRLQRVNEANLRLEKGNFTGAQVIEARRVLLVRSLSGPISRVRVGQAAGMASKELRQLAREWGLWVNSTTDSETGLLSPFHQLMRRLFEERGLDCFWEFYFEVEQDIAAQKELDRIRSRWSDPPPVPERIGIWRVIGTPFPAVAKHYGLSWWVRCRCAAPGCRYHADRWRPIEALKRSKATKCKQHAIPLRQTLSSVDSAEDAVRRMRELHVPQIFQGPAETRLPGMATDVLADLNRMLEDPPGLAEPRPILMPSAPRLTHPSLYFLPKSPAADFADFDTRCKW